MTTLQPARPSPIWKRVVAGIIDFFALASVAWPLLCLLGYGSVDAEIEYMRGGMGRVFPFVFLMGIWLFPFCLRDLVGGRSFGKWLLGLRVVDASDNEAVPTAGRLILRNVTIWLAPVGLASAWFKPDKMRFGDLLARTMVVEEPVGPNGPPMRRTVIKGVVFAGVIGGCWLFAQRAMTQYHETSRPYAALKSYAAACAPMRELVPQIADDNLPLRALRYWPTERGACAQAAAEVVSPERKVSLRVMAERPADNVSGWMGFAVQAGFAPPMAADNITGSSLNDAALGFLKTYEPLHTAVRDLRPETSQLGEAVVYVEKGVQKARLAYVRPADRWGARFEVGLERKGGAWAAFDASGLVDLNSDNAPARRVYIFLLSKDLHRYLSADEMEQVMRRGRPVQQVIPELRAPAGNAPAAR